MRQVSAKPDGGQAYGFRQTQPGSCGAASLLCAAIELGCTTLPGRRAWGELWTETVPLSCDQTSELRIFSVTSGSAGSIPYASLGHSLPSYICEVAAVLGLEATVFIANNPIGTLLEFVYRSEIARSAELRVEVVESPPPHPGAGERLLRVTRVGPSYWLIPAVALHWVMERPDGSIMDPAGAEFGHGPGLALNAPSLTDLVEQRKRQEIDCFDTGIGILFRQASG
ncbi:hypothetical protein [Solirhodobacter olei]|uniref:hypothetical protein n=1 Tax=Solirhodobacter olei TaxID=2493082 RepID=UPI000FD7E62C|nr:hypothetical protein [Solirhodobacter olei]